MSKSTICHIYYILYILYIYIYPIYIHLPENAIVRLPHPRSGDSQETCLAPSTDTQTRNHDTRVFKPPSLPINPKFKGIEP